MLSFRIKEYYGIFRSGLSPAQSGSFPVPTYLQFKHDERLGRNDVLMEVMDFHFDSLDAMRSYQATGNESTSK